MQPTTAVPLGEILRSANGKLPEGWLYLPQGAPWTTKTVGFIVDLDSLDESEITDEKLPVLAKRQGLVETVDTGTLVEIYLSATRLENPPSDKTLLEAFVYYYRFDAFLPSIDAPDPPPADVVIRNLDRKFYDSLVEDTSGKHCKREGCQRRKVKLSVFCKRHHFENVQRKPCPFDD